MQCSSVACIYVPCVSVRECACACECAWRDLCDFVTSSCRMGIPTRCHFLRSSSVQCRCIGGLLGLAREAMMAGSVAGRAVRCMCVGSAGSITGSEVVRDEFIGGLENTDQVVFLISVVVMAGRGVQGRRRGACGAWGVRGRREKAAWGVLGGACGVWGVSGRRRARLRRGG